MQAQSRQLDGSSRTAASSSRLLGDIARVAGFVVLLALSAQVKVYPPNSPVPVTMQTVAVLLCGFWLRPALALAATTAYLAAGFVVPYVAPGLPFFAAMKVGQSAVTLGYLVGFVAAAGAVSVMARNLRRLTLGRTLAVGLFGLVIVFTFGIVWFALLAGSLQTAIQQGLVPFAGWALVKLGLVAALVQAGEFVRK